MGMIPPTPAFLTLLRNYNPITEYTMPQLKEVFGQYGDEVLEQFKKYYKARNSSNPVEKLGEFYKGLDGELASISDAGIISGWVNYFKTESQKVRDSAIKKIGSPEFLNRNFPPKLNHTMSSENVYSPNVKPNVIDPNPKVPHMVSTGMDLPGYIQNNLMLASQTLGEIFNSNIAAVADIASENIKAHMGNLVPDQLMPDRIIGAAAKFTENALSFFGSASNFMSKNLGFNKYGVQNKNMSAINYKLNALETEQQQIKTDAFGRPVTKDIASLKRFKPSPTV